VTAARGCKPLVTKWPVRRVHCPGQSSSCSLVQPTAKNTVLANANVVYVLGRRRKIIAGRALAGELRLQVG
jgi:hypothetical protein